MTVLQFMNSALDWLFSMGAKHPAYGCVSNHMCQIQTHHLHVVITWVR